MLEGRRELSEAQQPSLDRPTPVSRVETKRIRETQYLGSVKGNVSITFPYTAGRIHDKYTDSYRHTRHLGHARARAHARDRARARARTRARARSRVGRPVREASRTVRLTRRFRR